MPLQEISGSARTRKRITDFEKGQINAFHKLKCSYSQISKALGIPRSTVQSQIEILRRRPDGTLTPRSGRPKKHTDRDDRLILRVAKKNPKATYAQIRAETGLEPSTATIRRILESFNLSHWIAKKRPLLTEKDAKVCLEWCSERKDWKSNEWKAVIFSDECSLERGSSQRREWVWVIGNPLAKWHRDCVKPFLKGKDISVMIWAGIWKGGRGNIFFLRRDELARRGGYTANSYIEVSEDQIARIYSPGMTFQQDNASIHTAKKVSKWLEEHGVTALEWPPYSPDLNPIEHLWAILKLKLNQEYPHLVEMGGSEQAYKALQDAIERCWAAIDQDIIDACIDSMERRVDTVLNAEGWYTKY